MKAQMKLKTLAWGLIGLVLMAQNAFGYVSTPPTEKSYHFKFSFQSQTYENEQTAGSWDEAYERAAQACFSHFKGGRKLAEEKGLDLIDVCANPRSI